MSKAYVKINISIHFDDQPFGLAVHHAGVLQVGDKAEAERVIEMLGNHVNTTFKQMGVQRQKALPDYVPDLALAFGGDPEPFTTGVEEPSCPYCKSVGGHVDGCPGAEGPA